MNFEDLPEAIKKIIIPSHEELRKEALHHTEQSLYHLKLANRKNFISTSQYRIFNYDDTVLMLETLIAILKSNPHQSNKQLPGTKTDNQP